MPVSTVRRWPKLKPGWYLLMALLIYSIAISVMLSRTRRAETELRELLGAVSAPSAPEGLWFPIAGARLPQDPAYLPGATRAYRRGVNKGFDFYGEDAGIPIPYGTPVIAADNGVIRRADHDYRELEPGAWQALIDTVAREGADEAQLDLLRGRQLWLETDGGLTLIYGHLSGIREGIDEGVRVYRGQVIGYVGNSGTDDGVAGTLRGARLHFIILRQDGSFVGEGLNEAQVRALARSLFVGP